MADKYRYKDGTPVTLEAGDHGIDLRNGTLHMSSLPEEGEYHALFEITAESKDEPLVCSRQHPDASEFNTVQLPAFVEFIHYGRLHVYPVEDYPRVAPLWRDRLLAEGRQLARSLQGDQAIAYEF